MRDKAFLGLLDELGWQRKRVAETLGVSTETLRRWVKDGAPTIAHVAIGALAKGYRP